MFSSLRYYPPGTGKAPANSSSSPTVPFPTETCREEADRLLLNEASVTEGAQGKPQQSGQGMTVQTRAGERLSHFLPQSPK